MTWISKVPAGCEHLDLALVERALAKHFGDIPRAAKELGVSGPDLNRLTWAKPKLLEEAEDRRGEVIARAWGQLITALYSDDPDRQMWASDKILSSWLARNHPLAPARRGRAPPRQVVFRWDGGDPATDALERDGQTLAVPRYSITPLASSTPSSPPLPKWPGPCGPPPLVANRYQPWAPPQLQAPSRREAELELESPSPSLLRRPSRGGWR